MADRDFSELQHAIVDPDAVLHATDPNADKSNKREDDFDPVEALVMERTINPGETPTQTTRRIIREAGPAAAISIIHLSRHAKNESVRLQAANVILDRHLGKAATQEWVSTHEEDARNPWDDILADSIRSEDEAIERAKTYEPSKARPLETGE